MHFISYTPPPRNSFSFTSAQFKLYYMSNINFYMHTVWVNERTNFVGQHNCTHLTGFSTSMAIQPSLPIYLFLSVFPSLVVSLSTFLMVNTHGNCNYSENYTLEFPIFTHLRGNSAILPRLFRKKNVCFDILLSFIVVIWLRFNYISMLLNY